MNRRGRASISTTTYSRAYIQKVWQDRGSLSDYERKGFAQFIYLTIAGQIESAIASIIMARLNSITHLVQWDRLPMVTYMKADKKRLRLCRTPIVGSIDGLVEYIEKQISRAPYISLKEQYSSIFKSELKTLAGDKLFDDLEALFDLRNLFAHGRNLYFEFEGEFPLITGIIDKNPIKKAADRLVIAGILKTTKFTMQDYHVLQDKLYTDEAILYFYKSAMEIEDRLEASMFFEPEKHMWHHQKLKALTEP